MDPTPFKNPEPQIQKRIGHADPPFPIHSYESFDARKLSGKARKFLPPIRKQDYDSFGNDFYAYKPVGVEADSRVSLDSLDEDGKAAPSDEEDEMSAEVDQSPENGRAPYFDVSISGGRQEASLEYDEENAPESAEEDVSAWLRNLKIL